MTQDDVPAVLVIQAECYLPAVIEDESSIRSRLDASPDSAWVAEDEQGVCAYLVAYRSIVGKVTPIGGAFDVATEPGTFYLHDLAVARRATGCRIGQALVGLACEQARAEGLAHSSLVSIQASSEFWKKHGYAVVDELDPLELANLQTYGGQGYYMVKRLRG
ncbi:MAG: family N-acetyltransferase [Proteobacteria bacterium]|nr:family N-acetyltransferase [Pseudomonadota bacterium]